MSAAALAATLSPALRHICLVESEQIGTVGVGESTIPHIRYFNRRIGLDERELMAQTQATFKLGIEFVDWARIGDSYIHAFGAFGTRIGGVAFHQHWLKRALQGRALPLDFYSLPIRMARANKFALPADDPASVLSAYGYAFQFDAAHYAKYLRRFSERLGVERIEGKVVGVRQRAKDGWIESLVMENGATIEGDLFIDCSGFRGLLIEQTLKTGYEEWTHWLPCDRAVAVPSEKVGPITPYTRATAREAGWQWRIPLQHRTGNGYVYSSQFLSDDEAAERLLSRLDGRPLAEPRFLRFVAGRRRRAWNKNCVAIGLSSGFLEPLESTSIYLIQIGITTLIDYLTDCTFDPRVVEAYNRWIAMEYDRVRDFLILHYHATERCDAPIWEYCRHMAIPDTLAHRLELFRHRGRHITYKDGLFLEPSWLCVYFGQRVIPRAYDPLVDSFDDDEVDQRMEAVRRQIEHAVARMPTHDEFLRAYCPASTTEEQPRSVVP